MASPEQEVARVINRELRKHLIELFFGWLYRPVTDRLWQLGQRLRGLDGQIWYAGDRPPTPDRPWWSLHT